MARLSGLAPLFPKRRPKSQWVPEGVYGQSDDEVDGPTDGEIDQALAAVVEHFNVEPVEGSGFKDPK